MKILNFGSLNIDKVYNVKEFVQPGETILALQYRECCGGKGLNQSIALAKAGADVYHAGIVGNDGQQLLDALREAGVHTELVKSLPQASGHAVIEVNSEGQNRIIVSSGTNAMIEETFVDEVLAQFESNDLLLLQNEISSISYILEKASEKGMTIVLNPSPVNEELLGCPLEKVTMFILNETEGMALSGAECPEPQEILEKLQKRFPDSAFVLTLGEKGACFQKGDIRHFQPAYQVDAVDTTAAGDTFCGFFIAEYSENGLPDEALLTATKASAIAVGRQGASPSIPTAQEVRERTF